MSEQEQVINSSEELKAQSSQLGQNLMAFLDSIKVSAKTAEERQTLNVYVSVCEVVEKIATGELVIVNSDALVDLDETPEEGEE